MWAALQRRVCFEQQELSVGSKEEVTAVSLPDDCSPATLRACIIPTGISWTIIAMNLGSCCACRKCCLLLQLGTPRHRTSCHPTPASMRPQ